MAEELRPNLEPSKVDSQKVPSRRLRVSSAVGAFLLWTGTMGGIIETFLSQSKPAPDEALVPYGSAIIVGALMSVPFWLGNKDKLVSSAATAGSFLGMAAITASIIYRELPTLGHLMQERPDVALVGEGVAVIATIATLVIGVSELKKSFGSH